MARSRRAVNLAMRKFRVDFGVMDDRQRYLIASRIDMLTDESLLSIRGWGPKTVAEVRAWSRDFMDNAGAPYRITVPMTDRR